MLDDRVEELGDYLSLFKGGGKKSGGSKKGGKKGTKLKKKAQKKSGGSKKATKKPKTLKPAKSGGQRAVRRTQRKVASSRSKKR